MTATERQPTATWSLELPGGRRLGLAAGRPRLLGVVNITPDSFSDGGRWLAPAAAIEQALRLVEEGAELLDLGAESTRPGGGVYGNGAAEVPPEDELARLLPVLEALRARLEIPISIDTRKAEVAERCLAAGADLINDVSALGDPRMGEVVAAAGCPVVLMHARGELATMQAAISFRDVVAEVAQELRSSRDAGVAAGIRREQIVLDPGLGFGKTGPQNRRLLRELPALAALGSPLLIGASRKSFLGEILAAPPDDRLPGSLAAAAWAAAGGAALLRVHDVAETRRFLAVWQAIAEAEVAA